MGKAPKPSRNTRLSQVADLKPLQGLTSLERLDLDGAKAVTSLRPLESLTNLRRLDLEGTKVLDLRPLKRLTGLEYLYLLRIPAKLNTHSGGT